MSSNCMGYDIKVFFSLVYTRASVHTTYYILTKGTHTVEHDFPFYFRLFYTFLFVYLCDA